MQVKFIISAAITAASAVAFGAHAQSLPQGLSGINLPQGLLGMDGLVTSPQTPSTLDDLSGVQLNDTGLRINALSPAAPSGQGDSGGVPGIDGLNFSPTAFANAFQGLDPDLLNAVLGDTDPKLLLQILRGETAELPGLEAGGAALLETLPGIDGLPIDLSR